MTTKLYLDSVARTHREGLVRFLRLLGCDGPTADDLAQEAFLALHSAEFEHRHHRATAAWLRKKARYLFLESVRIRDRRRESMQAELAEVVWIECAADDDGEGYRQALRECVAALPPRSREAVRLRYAEKASRDEMARILGLRPNGVKTLLQRIRAGLRRCVEKRRAR
jgi:RNA polymerase sigma-70 factor (ECF subfamily)